MIAKMIPHSCPDLGEKEVKAASEAILSLHLKGGPKRLELEEEIARDQGYKYAVATTSGSHAIHLGLKSLFPEGSANVGVSTYICRSVYDAIIMANCKPVLLDIDTQHYAPDLEQIKGKNLDALIVGHLFGIRAPIEEYNKLGMPIIEDCAQRIIPTGFSVSEPRVTIKIISFEATKLITCGEGGVLLTNDETIRKNSTFLRDGTYDNANTALWLPLTDLQASVALVQWKRLPEFLDNRKALAERYLRALESKYRSNIPESLYSEDNIFFRFVINTKDPESFIRKGEKHGVAYRKPIAPCCLHTFFNVNGHFPNAEKALKHLLSIPLYPRLTSEDALKVIETTIKGLDEQW